MQAKVPGIEEKIDILRQDFTLKTPKPGEDFYFKNNWKEPWTPHGKITLSIDTTLNKASAPTVLRPDEAPTLWSKHFFILFGPFLDVFVKEVFPFHLHLIIKSTPICPAPFPYLEFYMKAQYGNRGNLLADRSTQDLG